MSMIELSNSNVTFCTTECAVKGEIFVMINCFVGSIESKLTGENLSLEIK